MNSSRLVAALALAILTVASPAYADVADLQLATPPDVAAAESGAAPRTSCAVTSLDSPGSGVEPFVDTAASGARIGTAVGSLTLAVYPFSCSTVVFQVADPDRRIPREPLPEDTPFRGELAPVMDFLLA